MSFQSNINAFLKCDPQSAGGSTCSLTFNVPFNITPPVQSRYDPEHTSVCHIEVVNRYTGETKVVCD